MPVSVAATPAMLDENDAPLVLVARVFQGPLAVALPWNVIVTSVAKVFRGKVKVRIVEPKFGVSIGDESTVKGFRPQAYFSRLGWPSPVGLAKSAAIPVLVGMLKFCQRQ